MLLEDATNCEQYEAPLVKHTSDLTARLQAQDATESKIASLVWQNSDLTGERLELRANLSGIMVNLKGWQERRQENEVALASVGLAEVEGPVGDQEA
eukprot:15471524-Alexandrium_andersonii.AAC.1